MSFKPKVKKAQKKARARRAALKAGPVQPQKPEPPHVFPQFENAQLHSTSAHLAYEARGLERLMERKRWSNIG